jgi:hypothetical protein
LVSGLFWDVLFLGETTILVEHVTILASCEAIDIITNLKLYRTALIRVITDTPELV